MQSNFPADVESRLRAQEAITTMLHAQVHEVRRNTDEIKADVQELKRDNAAIKADVQELKRDNAAIKADVQELKGDVSTLKADMQELKSSVNERFDHVYGELADLKSNMVEFRNILATLVAKLG